MCQFSTNVYFKLLLGKFHLSRNAVVQAAAYVSERRKMHLLCVQQDTYTFFKIFSQKKNPFSQFEVYMPESIFSDY